jgi:hypothetical protein
MNLSGTAVCRVSPFPIGRGTHTGPLHGPGGEVPPTGKSLALPFCSTLRVTDGKIVSRYADSW